MTLLLIALALIVLVFFFLTAWPNMRRPGLRRRRGPARLGRGPITGRWGRRL
jgi:hypothetical protein